MISRSVLRQRHGLLSSTYHLSKASCTSPPSRRIRRQQQQLRSIHSIPTLGRHNDEILQNGIPGLFRAAGLEQSWTVYMRYILQRLNDTLANTALESLGTTKQVLIETARNPSEAHIFNLASQAHNHHYFMSSLSKEPGVEMPKELEQSLSESFSSIKTLRQAFLETANAMFGPGYVWLVLHFNPPDSEFSRDTQLKKPTYTFRILPTYIAGSPYPGAHSRLQSIDRNTSNVMERKRQADQENVKSPGFIANTDSERKRWGGADVLPVLCVSTWQHVYMYDWGVDGKQYYLKSWWDHIDWIKVWENAQTQSRGRFESKANNRRGFFD